MVISVSLQSLTQMWVSLDLERLVFLIFFSVVLTEYLSGTVCVNCFAHFVLIQTNHII